MATDLIAGKSFCFTGILSDMKRTEVERLIGMRGGFVHASVGRGTNYLVKGIRAGGTKLRAARAFGTTQITEYEFHEMLNPTIADMERIHPGRAYAQAATASRWQPAFPPDPGNIRAPVQAQPASPKPIQTKRRFALGKQNDRKGDSDGV